MKVPRASLALEDPPSTPATADRSTPGPRTSARPSARSRAATAPLSTRAGGSSAVGAGLRGATELGEAKTPGPGRGAACLSSRPGGTSSVGAGLRGARELGEASHPGPPGDDQVDWKLVQIEPEQALVRQLLRNTLPWLQLWRNWIVERMDSPGYVHAPRSRSTRPPGAPLQLLALLSHTQLSALAHQV
eukprot:1739073-Alexandrium_andersonii.AAC.1